MKIILSAACLVLLITSCNSSTEKKTDKVAPAPKTVVYPTMLQGQLDHFPLVKSVAIDSVFFNDSLGDHSHIKLSEETVRLLSPKFAKDDYTQNESYYLNSFYQIDAAKKAGKYEDFQKGLDIGMTRDAVCYALSRMEFGDSMSVVLWKLEFQSYEACPYFEGAHIMASLIRDGKVVECMQLAAHESGADAPMGYELYQLGAIHHKGILKTRRYSETVDEDVVVEKEKIRSVYTIGVPGFEEN